MDGKWPSNYSTHILLRHPADLAGLTHSFIGRASSWHGYSERISRAKSVVYVSILRKSALAIRMAQIVNIEATSVSSSAGSWLAAKVGLDGDSLTYLSSVGVFDLYLK